MNICAVPSTRIRRSKSRCWTAITCSPISWTTPAQPVPMLPLDRRTGVTEVEIGFDEDERHARGSPLPALLDQHYLRRQ